MMATTRKNILSKVMKLSWKIYREDSEIEQFNPNYKGKSWSDCLKAAWKWIKKNVINNTTEIINVIKETAKAVYAIVDVNISVSDNGESLRYTKMWIPKSILNGNSIPNWFIRRNSINY